MLTPEQKQKRKEFRREARFFLLSYPKCGRTWLRLMLGRALQRHFELGEANLLELDQLASLDRRVPTLWISHDDNPQWKTPNDIERDKTWYRDRRVIFLVRDPRDLVVSNFFQMSRRRQKFDGTLEDFVRHDVGGLDCIIQFFVVWAQQRSVPERFMLVRYEDIHDDTARELRRVLHFLELTTFSDEVVREAVAFSSFDRMHRMEREDYFGSNRLRPFDPADPESYKTRRGKVGGNRDYLSADLIEYMSQRIEAEVPFLFGYGTTREPK